MTDEAEELATKPKTSCEERMLLALAYGLVLLTLAVAFKTGSAPPR
ncbi:MAG: hypothetical protein JOZ90_12335 [Alphaproteobacteria bacterium]|nr:hypothetical protein [Alphaproteobacteria bacterium]MBV9371398.1 hypothetical protein [Alphaproteobacteria bacterium]MBV9901862.1 hypothetical protein [Alphaproteobacteria bacterium]